MKAYKGFDENLQCRGFQYEVGKEYETDRAKLCDTGFHACENPLDTMKYYPPHKGRYCEVELDATEERDDDTKRVGKRIKIETEIGVKGLIEAGVKFIFDKCEGAATTGWHSHAATTGEESHAATTGWHSNAATTGRYSNAATTGRYSNAATTGEESHAATTGEESHAATTGRYSHAATTGEESHAATTGRYSNAATTGEESHAATTGRYSNAATTGWHSNAATTGWHSHASTKNGVAAAIGFNGKAKGDDVGSYIVLADWRCENGEWKLYGVESRKVDGENIKAGVWYTMKDGKVVKA